MTVFDLPRPVASEHLSRRIPLLDPAPIRSDWIIDGEPEARAAMQDRAGAFLTAIWDCTAGTFHWHYGGEETIHILEGEAFVTAPDGTVQHLRAGDVAYFPARSVYRWHIPDYVRKFAVLERERFIPLPQLLRMVARRLATKALSLIRRGSAAPA